MMVKIGAFAYHRVGCRLENLAFFSESGVQWNFFKLRDLKLQTAQKNGKTPLTRRTQAPRLGVGETDPQFFPSVSGDDQLHVVGLTSNGGD